jgi:hypothetical protein
VRRATTRLLPPTLACCLALAGALAGCGGDSGDSLVQLQGSSVSISKATLDHWMRAKVGADFRASIVTKGPQGLVSEPANYAECAAAAKKIVPRGSTGELKLSDAQINRKCQELHQAVKEQALGFLIAAQWAATEAAQAGVHVSPALLHKEYERYRAQRFPIETELQSYLAERNWSVSDVLFEIKQNLLARAMASKLQAEGKTVGGGGYTKLVLEHEGAHIAKTSCKEGYVVPGCKEYREPRGGRIAPNLVLEAFVAGRASSKTPYQ